LDTRQGIAVGNPVVVVGCCASERWVTHHRTVAQHPTTSNRRGLFFIHTSKSKTHKLGISVALNFFVVKNIRDSYLLASFSQIFGCGSCNIVEN
jgi:hypothetical protein